MRTNLIKRLEQQFLGIQFLPSLLSYKEFRRRVNHNTNVLQLALANGENLIHILPRLYTMTSKPHELNSSILIRNAHDMLPAAYYGALANLNNNGADAFMVKPDHEHIKIEFKTSEIDSRKVWQGIRGGLYTGKANTKASRTTITSALVASYCLHTESIKQAKKIKTVLMISDTAADGYFDAWEMDGETVVKGYLHDKSFNATIKLGSFMKNGKRAKTVVPLIGLEAWSDKVREHAPVLLADEEY